jgi:alkylation response protein AidB-like acyl-CoA dehydrogenase
MDLDFTPQEREFRDEVRTWLTENVPREPRPPGGRELREYELGWQRRQYDAGWAGVAWPKEYGGRGLSLLELMIWHEEYARAEAPFAGVTFVGLNHGGPTLIARASEEQKAYHLPRILRGDVAWCQGFSEPGAGSDLASLQTRAVIDGDHLVVSGQKIWTSFADLADWQELLVRTDRDVPKHKGITWTICDMRTPGIEVRPIRGIAGGEAHFCEVFYDEVRIPIDNVVGAVNDGWSVAMSTLSFERGTAFLAHMVEMARTVEDLVDLARRRTGPDGRRPAIADDELGRRLATVRAEVSALRAMTYAGISRAARSSQPGPEGSMLRLFSSELSQRIARLALDILGDTARYEGGDTDRWPFAYLGSFQATIAAGTRDIQRNIIGERVLGLPR